MTTTRIDTYGRTWTLIQRSVHRNSTRWVVYCDSQCMLITHNRLIAESYMPIPADEQ